MAKKKKKKKLSKKSSSKKKQPRSKKLLKFVIEIAKLSELKSHPKNYRQHPEDQLAHIIASIEANGIYRNVIIAKDGTILAGHGVVKAAEKLGLKEIPVRRLDLDPDDPQAWKVIIGDNEIAGMSESDDRMMTDMLRELSKMDDLAGTGFDQQMLAALAMITRTKAEITDNDASAEWVGMPEFESDPKMPRLILIFDGEDALEDREKLIKHLELKAVASGRGMVTSYRWPARECCDDRKSVRFEQA